MKVLLVPNYSRADAIQAAATLEVWLSREGVEVVWAHDKKREPNRTCDPSGAVLVVSLGGDGTLLRAASIVGYREIPILGLSFGHLGFLTGAGSENIVESVSRALAGELHQSRRATLDVNVTFDCGGGLLRDTHHFALNELALTRGALGDMIEFDVDVSGNHIDRLRGDGFVVSTATGSTGYALSSGGPIVTGEFNALLEAHGIRHKYTRPFSPWQNGKVERMNGTLAREWQYARAWESEEARASALASFIERYNWDRPHSACGGLPPMSRIVGVNNVLAHNS